MAASVKKEIPVNNDPVLQLKLETASVSFQQVDLLDQPMPDQLPPVHLVVQPVMAAPPLSLPVSLPA